MRTLHTIMAAGVILAAILFGARTVGAQVGIRVYGGGTIPVGEFGRVDVDRTPPKSGATDGYLYGADAVWRFSIVSIPAVVSVGYGETHFGNDVPTRIDSDTLQFVTPQSDIKFPALRAGIRIIPWQDAVISPSIGGGIQSGNVTVTSEAFFGPAISASGTEDPTHLSVVSETERVTGVYGLAGVTVKSSERMSLFADAVYHLLFTEGAMVTTEFTPSSGDPQESPAASDFEWWELRAGVILYFPDFSR